MASLPASLRAAGRGRGPWNVTTDVPRAHNFPSDVGSHRATSPRHRPRRERKLAGLRRPEEASGSYARDTLGATSTESCATVAPPPPANVAENASSRL